MSFKSRFETTPNLSSTLYTVLNRLVGYLLVKDVDTWLARFSVENLLHSRFVFMLRKFSDLKLKKY